ncbi:MAG: hypothetical protein GQ470_07260 [Gammaproteobacteria bacterium]|nr:hypothetical protein [Gammaproteobacteria bacterium]
MNQKLKQRIIGAIVLISLAVIFIPFLLDGSHENIVPLREHQTPNRPNFYFEEIKLPPPVDAGRVPSRIINSSTDVSSPKQLEKQKKNSEPPVARAASKKPKIKTTAPTGNVDAPSAWVVQIVSLTNAKRALELTARLKKLGFFAFLEEIQKDGKTYYRVRVGPELEQAEAEAIRQKIDKKMNLDGKVMQFKPL